jgi:F-type H+-transporting ATPase subunit gamma
MEAAADDFLSFHPHLIPHEDESRYAYVVVGSERGFCGDFNESLMHALDRNAPTAEKGNVVAVGNKLSTTLAGDSRVAAFVDGPSVAEEVEAVLVKLMEALTRLNAARSGSLRITVLHHRADQDDVSMSVLRPFRRADGARAQFAYAPLLNTEPRAFLTGLVEQYLSAMLYELLYSSLMAENQRRMQHMDSAVSRLEKTLGEFLLRRNTLRQEEITEEIEVIMLSIEALK